LRGLISAINATPETGLARVGALRALVKAALGSVVIPGAGMGAREEPDGLVIHRLAEPAPNGQLFVTTGGGVRVVPGLVTLQGDDPSFLNPALPEAPWLPGWEGVPDWEGGGTSDTPQTLLSGVSVVAVKVVRIALNSQTTSPTPLPEADPPPCLVYLPLPLPARVWEVLPGEPSTFYVPLAVIFAGISHQLTLGPLKIERYGRCVFVQRQLTP
jgi:hypothetical protein